MGRYLVSDRAEQDLIAIWEYASQDKPIAALELVEELHAKFRLVADAPFSGHPYRTGSEVRLAFVRRYVVYYRPADEGINVLRVLPGDMEQPSIEG